MENRNDYLSDSGRLSISAYLSQGERIRYAVKASEGATSEEAIRLLELVKATEEELWKWKAEKDTVRGLT